MDKKYLQFTTEENNRASFNIDTLSTIQVCQIINNEDQKVALAINEVLPEISQAIELIISRFKNNGRLIYVGAGSSGRIGFLDASEMGPTFNMPFDKVKTIMAGGHNAFIKPVEGAEDDEIAAINDLQDVKLTSQDIVLGIAASGTTPYVLSALRFAKKHNALTIGLCMNEKEMMHQISDKVIKVIVGPEVISGSTRMKAGSATKLILNMISTTLMIKLGKVYKNYMIDLQASNFKLKNRAINIVAHITGVTHQEALSALLESNYSCRHAIVMINKKLSLKASEELLNKHHQNLREIL